MIDLDIIARSMVKKKRLVLAIVLLPTLLAFLLSLLWPKEYLAETSVLPNNAQLNDKSRFFSENIRDLVSTFGTADDLDRLYATARSGLTYDYLVDKFNLIKHYSINPGRSTARNEAIRKLKSNSYILKTEFSEIRIGVWDRDPQMAAALANGFVTRIQQVNEDLFSSYYSSSIQKLENALHEAEQENQKLMQATGDSTLNVNSGNQRLSELTEEINRYKKIIGEYRVAMLAPPPSLVVLEKATPALEADRPKTFFITIATFFVSLVAAVFLIALTNRK